VDVGNIKGLPYLAANQPATLYYEQGTKQEIVGVWIQPGSPQSASPATTGQSSPGASGQSPPSAAGGQGSPSASVPAAQSLDGVVEAIGMAGLQLRTSDGHSLTVGAADVG